jgi:hypothetical protein
MCAIYVYYLYVTYARMCVCMYVCVAPLGKRGKGAGFNLKIFGSCYHPAVTTGNFPS